MTVAELLEEVEDWDKDEEVSFGLFVPELSYVVAALEQWCEVGELYGRTLHPEVDWFLQKAYESLRFPRPGLFVGERVERDSWGPCQFSPRVSWTTGGCG